MVTTVCAQHSQKLATFQKTDGKLIHVLPATDCKESVLLSTESSLPPGSCATLPGAASCTTCIVTKMDCMLATSY
jgi:hypothetical protein